MIREIEFHYIIVRGGADYGELYALGTSTPTIRMTSNGEIKTSFSGDFAVSEGMNWLSAEIRPEMWINGTRYALGNFLPATVQDRESNGARSIHVEAYDRCWRVKDTLSETTLHFTAGTYYLTVIKDLLAMCGITLVSDTPNASRLSEDRADWPIGTSYLSIINELLDEINYNPLWFDSSGLAILEPATIPDASQLDHRLDYTNVQSMLLPSMTKENDVYKAANHFICVCSNPDKGEPLVATATNTNPNSPASVWSRGRRIAKLVRVNNIASQAALQEYADRLVSKSLFSGEKVTVQTALLPGWGVYDVTSLVYRDFSGLCMETAWTMQLKVGGTMSHTLERVVINIG